jgi:hypothetical protein
MSKAKPHKSAKITALPGGWQLFRLSLGDFGNHLWRYIALVGIVVVPSNLIGLSASLSSDSSIMLYENLASLFMTAGLIWSVSRGQHDPDYKLRRAYYDGSAMVLRLVLVIAVLAVMFLPAAIGVSLYGLGAGANAGSASVPVQLLLGALAIILSLPTFYWLIRFGVVIFRVATTDEWPIEALRNSRLLTLGRFWYLAGRIAQLLLWVVIIMIVPVLLFIGLALLTHAVFFIVLFQISFSLIALPIIALYTYRLYQVLAEV